MSINNIAILIETIKEAFSDRRYPGDENIIEQPFCGILGNGDLDDPLPLIGKRWQDIGPEFFFGSKWESLAFNERKNRSLRALSFLTNEGFRYFAPAYMIMGIQFHEFNIEYSFTPTQLVEYGKTKVSIGLDESGKLVESEVLIDMTDHLNHLQLRLSSLQIFNGFTEKELAAIIAFLEYKIATKSDEHLKKALDEYWYIRFAELSKGEICGKKFTSD